MPFNLFALCARDEDYVIKRIPLNPTIQNTIFNIFDTQKENFLRNRTETPFSGDWKPDDDEILTIPVPDEAQTILNMYNNESTILMPILDLNEFNDFPIKALFGSVDNGHTILVQKFSQSQYLSRKFSLFLDNSTYNKLDTPTISLDSKLLCVISDGIVKFDNFSNMRCVFDMKGYYQEATNGDIDLFAVLPSICVENVENLKTIANQNIRKRIHNLLRSNVLNDFSATEICNKAQEHGFENLITVQNDKIALPNDAKEIIKILCFLDEKLYRGVFSELVIMANSTKNAE